MPPLTFAGKVTLIEDMASQKEAAKILRSYSAIGFDTESRACFKKGQKNQIALLQLSTPDQAFLIRLNRTHLSKEIVKILQSSRIKKIGAAVKDDISELQSVTPFFSNGFVDLQKEMRYYGISDIGLKKMAAIILKGRLSKAQRLSNWAAQNLTDQQIAYAATDAWVCLMIYERLAQEQKIDITKIDGKDISKKR